MAKRLVAGAIITILAAAGLVYIHKPKTEPLVSPAPPPSNTNILPPTASSPDVTATASPNPQKTTPPSSLALPITDALSRVTKKPFGIYVTPQNSPVQPERFTGYHTGADFETIPQEQNIDVPIFAICSGMIKQARYASGYGGVIVESCSINSQSVTVTYGHLRQSSFKAQAGQAVNAGSQLAVLGTGYSSETDGERKHLHLGIHKGPAIDILGYVQNKADLVGWLDPLSLLR